MKTILMTVTVCALVYAGCMYAESQVPATPSETPAITNGVVTPPVSPSAVQPTVPCATGKEADRIQKAQDKAAQRIEKAEKKGGKGAKQAIARAEKEKALAIKRAEKESEIATKRAEKRNEIAAKHMTNVAERAAKRAENPAVTNAPAGQSSQSIEGKKWYKLWLSK